METLAALAARRSIRRFRPDPIPAALLLQMLEAARQAPSATNCQPWKFLVVRSPAGREALREAAYGQRMFVEAPATIVCLGDRQIYKKRLRRGRELIEIGAVEAETMEKVGEVYACRARDPEADEQAITLNCALAIQNLIVAAAALGLGTCWVRLMDEARVAEALALPAHLFPVALVPVGYAAEQPGPRPRYELSEIAWDERVGEPFTAVEVKESES